MVTVHLVAAYSTKGAAEQIYRLSSEGGEQGPFQKFKSRFALRLLGACYLVVCADEVVGFIHLKDGEIAVRIAEQHRRKGYGRAAVSELMRRHPGPFKARIAADNAASLALFKTLGFETRSIEVTHG